MTGLGGLRILWRGRSVMNVLERYHDTVKPSHLQFIELIKRYADIIPGGGENQVGLGAYFHN